MKKSLIVFASILIIFTSLISAYSYDSASLGNALDSIGGENLGLLIVFLVSFALITVILNRTRFFEENRSAATIIALMLTLGITYFGFYKTGISASLDIAGLFYGLGIPEMTLDLIVFFGVVGLVLFLLYRYRANAFLIMGSLMIALSLAGLASLYIVGFALLFIWILAKIFGIGKSVYDRTYFSFGRRGGGGYGGGPSATMTGGTSTPRGGFSYIQGMRRGGEKGTRSRFVKKVSTERYARIYGNDAARRRFG